MDVKGSILMGGALLAAMVSVPAQAHEGLQWQWDVGSARTFLLRAQVQLPEVMDFNKERNMDARVAEYTVSVVTTCTSLKALGKTKWELKCAIDDFQMSGAPHKADTGKLIAIFDEMDAKLLDGGFMQFIYSVDGRILNYDLEGVDASNTRNRHIQENLRLVLGRAFAAMDLQLPKNGDDLERPWQQKASPLSMHFPSEFGTVGTADVNHQVSKAEGDKLTIETVGHGMLGPGEYIEVRTGTEQLRNTYDLSYRGIGVFDTATGTWIEREYLVDGMPTPSSVSAQGHAGVSYVQAVRIEFIAAGTEAVVLGPNEETAPSRFIPGSE